MSLDGPSMGSSYTRERESLPAHRCTYTADAEPNRHPTTSLLVHLHSATRLSAESGSLESTAPRGRTRDHCSIYGVLRAALNAELLARSLGRGINLPQAPKTDVVTLRPEELHRLAAGLPHRWQPMVYAAGGDVHELPRSRRPSQASTKSVSG